jgi:polyferredoxin
MNQERSYNKRRAARLYDWSGRNWFQLAVFVLTLALGVQFFYYVQQAMGPGPISIQRPAGVEGFLPIGAFMGWKLFIQTGFWDPVHPAAMVILGYAALVSLILRKSFCGWFCPAGTLSEWLWKLGQKLFGKTWRLPKWLDIPLRGLKYFLLGFFVWVILRMSVMDILSFLNAPYYTLSDVKMLHFFTRMTGLTAVVLAGLVIASLFIRNFWCRYLCPYGALMGLFSLLSPTRIKRNLDTCIDCGSCSKVCPHSLPVADKPRIISSECSGCMECTLVCPVADTLELKTPGLSKRVWSTTALGLAVGLLFLGTVFTAEISGNWQSKVPQPQFRMMLKMIDSPQMTHPDISGK